MAKERYDHKAIEESAQAKWKTLDLYATDLTDAEREKYYLLFEFPYPSGDLHIGHWYAFALTDIYARYLRMRGKNVLFPIGFDAFGLPAENAAIKHGVDAKDWTYSNMEEMRAQIRSMGTSVDWSKEVVTCDPSYYKWTQWLFAKLFEQGLAERRNAAVKWCPQDQTVLANEQVMDGRCDRCGSEVEEKNLTQWFLKITNYADRLLRDLEPLSWREDIKEAQRAWIGESEGAKLSFALHSYRTENAVDGEDMNMAVEVFTTRPDTLFGATYLVLAPEHPLVETLLASSLNPEELRAYREATSRKTERERSENREKTGVLVGGVMAINPANKEPIPVYIADYVLASYGTGAVMAVPAHDERDFEFATKHALPIKYVVIPEMIDEGNPPVAGKEEVARTLVLAIVRDPKTGKYLALKWKKEGWTTFITGGAEEGEDLVEAAKREVAEETGYTDLSLVRVLDGPIQSRFFASHKDVNRVAVTTSILFELKSDARDEVAEEERAQHEAVWLDLDEITAEKMRHAEIAVITGRMARNPAPYLGDGILIHSGEFRGRANREAMWDIAVAAGGERMTNYRLRDWLVSRQRYWGCPIPVVYDPEGVPHLVPQEHLPWLLPEDVNFAPTGESPLASSKELKDRVTRIFGEGWTPEYDTLDTFVDSSWYYLRYLDPNDDHDFTDQAMLKKWLPVDRYSGGSEHTTMHLLYSRFFHKALYDMALVPTPEPFRERYNRGLILGPDGQKMSKSKGNVVNPDEFVGKYGSDAVRIYLAFIGPYNEPGTYPWNLDGVVAMRRFLERVYALRERVLDEGAGTVSATTVGIAAGKVGSDIERFKFNTAISTLMIALRELEQQESIARSAYLDFLHLLSPFAPHLTEHLHEAVSGEEGSIHGSPWPEATAVEENEATIIVQVNGKKRGEMMLAKDAGEDEALARAKDVPTIAAHLEGKEVKKIVYVAGRVLNLVVAS
ncbi:MAG TPA: class I tRNA ligase family protein [Candidatus Paceibacterota bacterium]|nr:class I tRNA ligase family protein [Candidatus Paceibacterota bacterium]